MSPKTPAAERLYDDIPKIDGAVSVGEDLAFQERWWQFENLAWVFLVLILLADLLGAFGRGWLAQAERISPDGAFHLSYERVERAGTPSEMTLRFKQEAIHDNAIQFYASESLIAELGAQRIIPEPQSSSIGSGGLLYVFPTKQAPATVRLSLEPSFVGLHTVTLHVQGEPPMTFRILVLP